jgi:hypothetical protein
MDPRVAVLDERYAADLAFIEFHMYWPGNTDPFYQANIPENMARYYYYPPNFIDPDYPGGVWYVPRFFMDGAGADSEWFAYDPTGLWERAIQERIKVESPLEITLDIDFDGASGTVDAHITSEQDLTSPDLVIHFVLTESEISFAAPNGVNNHNNVMRRMLPDSTGAPFSILNGQTLTKSQPFTIDPQWVPGHCGFVVFVQDNSTREILQAAESRLVTSVSLIDHELFDSGGDGDGNFEAGETVDFSISLRNLGPLATDVTASLNATDPDITILTGNAQFDDIPINGTVDNVDLPFTFQVSQDVQAHFTGLTVDVSVNGGQIAFQEEFEILVGKPHILIVNDDHIPPTYPWDYDAERFYREPLYARGETYHVWNTPAAGVPEGAVLNDYDVVIWFTGASEPAITPEDVAALTAYLDSGGDLIISGQDIASDLQGSDFLSNYLHAEFVTDSSADIWMKPAPGDPIMGNLQLLSLVSGKYGADNQDSPDEIRALAGATPVLTYFNSGQTAALRYMNGYRVVYFAFGFESFVNFYNVAGALDMRADILQRIFDWFQYEPQVGDINQDGWVNIIDVLWVVNIVLEIQQTTPEMIWAADINQDGTINIIDAIALVNIILGR